MGKPARLTLTILLFLGLGLATSVAVAWGAQARIMATETVSISGVMTQRWLGVSLYRGVSMTEEGTLLWRLPDDGRPPNWSNLRQPPRDSHTRITVFESGWPWRCLGYELEREAWNRETLDLGQRGALYGTLELSRLRQDWKDVYRLPYFVNPLQLIANTLFWVLAWLAFFCLPSLWRINQWYLLKPQRYCAWCRFDMKHATEDICPECGNDQSRRPQLVSKPAASLAFLILLIGSVGIAGLATVFITKHETEPIHWAAYLGDVELVKQELTRGVDADIKATEGECEGLTPLHLAVINNRKEVAKLLLEAGAKIRGSIYLNDPPEIAAENGLTEIMGVLIEHGLDVNVPSADRKTLLERAAVENNFDIVDVLREAGADDKVVFSDKSSLLHLAVEYGHKDFAEELIELGHDVNLKDGDGQTPLLLACRKTRIRARRIRSGYSDMTKMLIARGAAVDLDDSYGVEPIHVWARWWDTEILQLLIEKGADVNKATSNGSTPLMLAAASSSYDAVKLLLEYGADVNMVKRSGFTELRFMRGVLYSWERFSPRGVNLRPLYSIFDVNDLEGQNWSPLARSIIQRNENIADLLLDNGAEIDVKVLAAAVCTDQYELFNDLVVRGGDVLERHPTGETLLFYRSDSNTIEIWKNLIESGVDVNAVNQKGETALMKAAYAGRPHHVRFLLNHGADPTIRLPDGSTALEETYDLEIRELLEVAIAEHGGEEAIGDKP